MLAPLTFTVLFEGVILNVTFEAIMVNCSAIPNTSKEYTLISLFVWQDVSNEFLQETTFSIVLLFSLLSENILERL